MRADATTGMATIAGTVAVGAAVAPGALLRAFGVPEAEITGAARFGWRLFAVRTGWLAVRAARGDEAAAGAFLPVQIADQVVFWHALARRDVPPRTAVLAAGASGVLIALDVVRRRGGSG